jgi:Holliday junction resolvasome RuvABC ATP-dependent DNA helicase subunit
MSGLLIIFLLCIAYGYYEHRKKNTLREYQIQINSLSDADAVIPVEGGNSALDVHIKGNQVDTSKITAYTGEAIKKFEFRPQTWTEFISQDKAKEEAKTIVKKIKRGIKGHMILSALKGHGKTTFIELFAKSLGAKLIERIGRQIDEDEIVNIVNEINQSKEQYVILFIDEIDTMDWKVLKIFNTIIEQFKINEKQIKPFIFASATISKHLLVKNNPDLLDRIPHSIQFVRYNAEDIAQIIRQYQSQLYPEDTISDNVIVTISQNCKFNPRTSISLLEDYIVEQNITKVLRNRHIIIDGLDIFDIKILDILSHSNRPLGSNALSLKVGMSELQYLREIEPFLLEFGYIQRIPSRAITAQGLDTLRKIEVLSNAK